MAAVAFDPSYFSLVVFLSAFIPGVALGWPLLKKSGISLVEKLVLCFLAGMFIPPALLMVEDIFGLMFSLQLVLANIALVTLAGAILWYKEKAYEIKFKAPSFDEAFSLESAKKFLPLALLLVAMFLAFWLRVQTYSPIYSELDPYFYVYGTGQIIRFGEVPYPWHDDTAWWPEVKSLSHRGFPPLKMYLEAQWYSLYTNGAAYNNYLLFVTSSWLPPVSAALMAFGAYLLFSTYFDRRYGVFAAFLTSILPVTVFKMSAGVNEAAPFGMAAIFLVTGIYAVALRRKDVALGAFAGLALFASYSASNYTSVILYPLAGFIVLQSLLEFAFPKKEEAHAHKDEKRAHNDAKAALKGALANPLVQINIALFAWLIAGVFVQAIYIWGLDGLKNIPTSTVLIPIGALAASIALECVPAFGIPRKKRLVALAGMAVIGMLVLLIPNPLGAYAKDQVSVYVGAADFNVPLDRTIAEQNRAGTTFESEAGFLALVTSSRMFNSTSASGVASEIQSQGVQLPSAESAKLSSLQAYGGSAVLYLPDGRVLLVSKEDNLFVAYLKNHQVSNPGGMKDSLMNAAYSGFDILASVSTAIGNAALAGSTAFFNAVLGKYIETDSKDSSLAFFFLAVSVIGLVWDAFVRKAKGRENSTVALLILLLILPMAYIGMNKIKYTLLVGIALVMAATVAIGEIERLVAMIAERMKIADGRRYVAVAFTVLLFATVVAEATIPSDVSLLILGKSASTRYQDNPSALMPKLASMCESLREKNYYDEEICNAGYNASFADTINNQYNYKVCLVSQLEMAELFPGNSTGEQQRSADAKSGAAYRCNRLADYWVESEEWISKNLPFDARVNSWWDYGHWTNYFGDRKTVLRNEHSSKGMIGRVAHDFIIGSNQDLIDSMNYFDSQYVLFDAEIIGSDTFGAKYGALNYLGCAHEGETNVRTPQGTSACEFEHSPEQIVVPKVQNQATACVISESQMRTGVKSYRITQAGIDSENPTYCVGEVTLANGQKMTGTYYMDRKDANGDLAVSKGLLRQARDTTDYIVAEIVYNNQKIWQGPNGTLVDGMGDAKNPFYFSNLYSAFYNENLPGFDMVFKSKGGEVKIFKMKDSLFKGNKDGWIDPAYANRTQ